MAGIEATDSMAASRKCGFILLIFLKPSLIMKAHFVHSAGGCEMRTFRSVVMTAALGLACAAGAHAGDQSGSTPAPAGGQAAPAQPGKGPMILSTTAFPDGGPIPVKFTQAGEQVSPALTWTNPPANTVSFVLHMHDLEVARN